MSENLLMTWVVIGAEAVAGYFIIKHLTLWYMARGGHVHHSGSEGIAFFPGDSSVACGDSSAACGDGGGGGGGGGD
jgi:hypothetical protein